MVSGFTVRLMVSGFTVRLNARRNAWAIAVLIVVGLIAQLVPPLNGVLPTDSAFGVAQAWADPWPPGPGPGPGPGPDFGSGGGSQFQPPSMPSSGGSYSGTNMPGPAQSNGIDINNPAPQMSADEQAGAAQYPAQGPRTPVHGQQPPNYDLPPQQQPAQQPQQEPAQQSQQQDQQPAEQQQDQQPADQQQSEESQNAESEQQRNNDCEPNNFIPSKQGYASRSDQEKYGAFARAARSDPTYEQMRTADGVHRDHVIALRRLWDIPGFKSLDLATQVRIANLPDNLKPLFGRWNSSKQDKLASEWVPSDRVNPQPSAEDMAAMCADEQAATQAVLREIQEATAQQASDAAQSSIPKQTSIDPPQAPVNDPAKNAPQQQPAPQTDVAPPNQPPSSPQPPNNPPVPRQPSRTSGPPAPPSAPPAQEPVTEPSPQLPGWVKPVGVGVGVVVGIAACVVWCAPAAAWLVGAGLVGAGMAAAG